MSTIIAGNFDTFDAAQAAKADILSEGLPSEDVSVFYITPPGQHHKLPLGGDAPSDPGARHTGKGAFMGIAIGALVLFLVGLGAAAAYRLATGTTDSLIWIIAPLAGALVGAYVGSLAGAMSKTREKQSLPFPDAAPGGSRDEPQRPSAVMLAAHVNPQSIDRFKQILARHGAQRLEKADGQWASGHWVDFDSARPFTPL